MMDRAVRSSLTSFTHFVFCFEYFKTCSASVIAVPLGARANQRLHLDALKYLFAVFFFLMGMRFVLQNGRALLP